MDKNTKNQPRDLWPWDTQGWNRVIRRAKARRANPVKVTK